jgi:hypothetical protein
MLQERACRLSAMMLRARGRNRLFRPPSAVLAGIPLPFCHSDAFVDSSLSLLTPHDLLLDDDHLVTFALCESWEWHTVTSAADLPTGDSHQASNPTRARFTAEAPRGHRHGLRRQEAH